MTKQRKIELKKVTMTIKGQNNKGVETDFDYKSSLIGALNEPPVDERTGQQRGFGPVEMRKRLKVLKQVEECKDNKLLLDESEYNELKKCVNEQKWKMAHPTIMQYIDDVENAEEVEVAEKK